MVNKKRPLALLKSTFADARCSTVPELGRAASGLHVWPDSREDIKKTPSGLAPTHLAAAWARRHPEPWEVFLGLSLPPSTVARWGRTCAASSISGLPTLTKTITLAHRVRASCQSTLACFWQKGHGLLPLL